jgi:hypothetical protein
MKKLDWIPQNIDECMKAFEEMLSPEEQLLIIRMSKSELGSTHHGLGQFIRNNWGLWNGGHLLENLKALGFKHADDMSMSLIEEWWSRMNNVPSSIDDNIKEYAKFWERK